MHSYTLGFPKINNCKKVKRNDETGKCPVCVQKISVAVKPIHRKHHVMASFIHL